MFKEADINKLCINPFTKLGNEWAILAAGSKDKGFNMMTASWGGFGVLWSKNTATVYVRESRYTRQFFDSNDLFTVSFYEEKYREALNKCGFLHGNQCDKAAESGLTPYFTDDTTAFEEADLIFVCRKLFHTDLIREAADDKELYDEVYPEPDIHRMYIGDILKVLEKQ